MDIADSICTNELIEEVHNFLSEKPKDIQQIFFMRFSLELSISEIAKLLDSKESGIKNKLYRTINEIRQFYREKGDNI
jgi:DNA-directed RNA polymerase specialized sigma24 family protein